jgi:hypothetical protein
MSLTKYHYTTVDGHKAISSQPDWTFRAAKPPGPHPFGAYFTALPPSTPRLCSKLLIPRVKVECVFEFTGGEALLPIEGGRGQHIVYSPVDYVVPRASGRQSYAGRTSEHPAISGDQP